MYNICEGKSERLFEKVVDNIEHMYYYHIRTLVLISHVLTHGMEKLWQKKQTI